MGKLLEKAKGKHTGGQSTTCAGRASIPARAVTRALTVLNDAIVYLGRARGTLSKGNIGMGRGATLRGEETPQHTYWLFWEEYWQKNPGEMEAHEHLTKERSWQRRHRDLHILGTTRDQLVILEESGIAWRALTEDF